MVRGAQGTALAARDGASEATGASVGTAIGAGVEQATHAKSAALQGRERIAQGAGPSPCAEAC